jgi:hypothetical protein
VALGSHAGVWTAIPSEAPDEFCSGPILLKSFIFLTYCFMRLWRRNNSQARRNHFRFRRRTAETAHGYQFSDKNGGQRRAKAGDSHQMRTLSFLLAFAVVFAGPTLAGSPDGSLPGFGTFAYSGSPIVNAAPSIIVAAR